MQKSTQFLFQLDNYQEQKSGSRGVQCDKLFPVSALHWCATQKFWPRIASHIQLARNLWLANCQAGKLFEKNLNIMRPRPLVYLSFFMGIKVQNVQCTNFLVGILFQPLRVIQGGVKLPCQSCKMSNLLRGANLPNLIFP